MVIRATVTTELSASLGKELCKLPIVVGEDLSPGALHISLQHW